MLPVCNKLRSSNESEKVKQLMQREKLIAEKEQELIKRESVLKNQE